MSGETAQEPPRRDLLPAEHVMPAPAGGWAGADLDDDELVDDEHIAADPTSWVVSPDGP